MLKQPLKASATTPYGNNSLNTQGAPNTHLHAHTYIPAASNSNPARHSPAQHVASMPFLQWVLVWVKGGLYFSMVHLPLNSNNNLVCLLSSGPYKEFKELREALTQPRLPDSICSRCYKHTHQLNVLIIKSGK